MARKKDYEVGYGKPPKHTQFKKGKSGNPNGKPRKVPTHAEIVERELDKRITITEDGKQRRVTKREVMHKSTIQKAMKGDLKAVRLVMELDAASRPIPGEGGEVMRVTLVFEEEERRREDRWREEHPDWRDEDPDAF